MKNFAKKLIATILIATFIVGVAPITGFFDLFPEISYAADDYSLEKVDGVWYYFDDGEIDTDYVGLAKNEYCWWYVENGTIDFTYTGMAKNQYGWWYVTNGKLDLTYTGLAKNQYGWWYMNKGKLDLKYTGMAKNQYGWWYVTNGKLDKTFNGLAKNQYGWWYMNNGTINYDYVGLAKNQYGWWYITNGTIDFTYNGVAQNSYGWWKVKNGKVTVKAKEPSGNQTTSNESGTLGFMWDGEDKVFYSAKDPWQRAFGYNKLYDWAAQLVVLYYDTVRVKFNYGGYDWLVQLWKGQYGFVLIGAEVGVYYKNEGTTIEHYICNDNDKRLKIGYTCYNHGEVLFERGYLDTWWLTGFVPGKLDRFNDRSQMALDLRITLKTTAMRRAFVGGLENLGFTYGNATKEDPDTYYVKGNDVYIYWQYITEM